MEYLGNIRKMRSVLNSPLEYFLRIGESEIKMNDLIGSEIYLEYLDEINCVKCGNKTKKSFSQGFCYPCFISAPETEECVLRPELCRAHEGVARDMKYAERNCLIEHLVYISITSGIKVGVTRSTQVPTRWIDQGAVKAIELARTPNRFIAGQIEVALKSHMQDKTNWRNMLKNEYTDVDLKLVKEKALSDMPEKFRKYRSIEDDILELNYPVNSYPAKVSSLNLEKEATHTVILQGIKGQYLLFNYNRVINIRKYGGYKLKISY